MIQTENGPAALTYAQFKARKKRREVPHPIVVDYDAYLAYRAAERDLRNAQQNRRPAKEIAQREKDLEQAEAALRAATLVTRLRALPRETRGGEKSYSELRAEHPPTEDDHAQVASDANPNAKAQFHADTFGPALVAACLIEPKVTVEQAAEMAADLNEAEWSELFQAAILVNQTSTPTAGLVFS